MHLLVPVKSHAVALHRGRQFPRNFGVEKRQQLIAPIDNVDLGAKRRKRAAIFTADHARADHRERLGNPMELQDRIGIVNLPLAERKHRGLHRRRSRGDENIVAAHIDGVLRVALRAGERGQKLDADGVGIEKRGRAKKDIGMLVMQLLDESIVKSGPDPLFVAEKVGDGHLAPHRKIDAVKVARLQPRQRQRRFAQRLAGHGARVDSRAAEFIIGIDERHLLVPRRCRVRGDDARRAPADDDQVVVFDFVRHKNKISTARAYSSQP